MSATQFIVYMATNTVNGKRYIGATSRGLRKRRNHHVASAKAERRGCSVLYAALRKYGESVFSWKIISELNSVDEMLNEEIRLISELKPEYNVTVGGRGVIGVPRSPEWKAKIGKKISRAVTCTNSGIEYPSLKAAAEAYDVTGSRVSVACRNGGFVKGVQFRFSDQAAVSPRWLEPEAVNERECARKRHIQKAIASTRRSVVCLDNGKLFSSITLAAKSYDISPLVLSQSIRRGQRCKGFTFVQSRGPISEKDRHALLHKMEKERFDHLSQRNGHRVVSFPGGLNYMNLREAAEAHDLTPERIGQLCRTGGKTRNGQSFFLVGSP